MVPRFPAPRHGEKIREMLEMLRIRRKKVQNVVWSERIT
jgi:hypothetical protein